MDGFFAQTFQYVVGFLVDNLTPVDDFLSAQYDAVGPGVVVEHFFPCALRTFLVVGKVRQQIFVERALTQKVAAIVHGVGVHQVGIGAFYRKQLVGIALLGQFVVDNHDGSRAVLTELFNIVSR